MSRERILERIRQTRARREAVPHPGPFGGWRDGTAPAPLEGFATAFVAAGGEVGRVPDEAAAGRWLSDFAGAYRSIAVGVGVPPALVPERLERLQAGDEARAEIAVSMARAAVAETGSLVMDARDGRRSQLLAPVHVVMVRTDAVHGMLHDALGVLRTRLPSALGLHSGPSKSADIGQIMVRGVHGPGRVIALLVGRAPTA